MNTSIPAQSAAEALVAALPVHGVTVAGPVGLDEVGDAKAALCANTGTGAVEIGLLLVDVAFVATAGGAPDAEPAEVLRPAFEAAAAAASGDGRVGPLSEGPGAQGIFADDKAEVFELVYETTTFGWLAVRVRDTAEGAGDPELAGRLGRIHDVEMALSVEIGRTRMNVRDALAMEPGKVIELDRSAGAPVDVMLNGRKIALGEVVVVDQDYGVRITRILDVAEAPR